MSALSRTKGASGERELAALLSELSGRRIARRVRQHAGDSDLMGLDGWVIECKRTASAYQHLKLGWWRQTAEQARAAGAIPVLFFRQDRGTWRAIWPAWTIRPELRDPAHDSYLDTVEADALTWWRLSGRLPVPAV